MKLLPTCSLSFTLIIILGTNSMLRDILEINKNRNKKNVTTKKSINKQEEENIFLFSFFTFPREIAFQLEI